MLPTAGTLAATGDVVAALAIVIGAVAIVSLIGLIIAKKVVKSSKKSEWKYPF